MATFVFTGTLSALWSAGANWNVGGVAQVSPPTAADDVAVGTGTGATNNALNIDSGAVCRSLDFTGYTGTVTHDAITLTIGDGTAGTGSIALKMVSGMTYTKVNAATSAITYASTSATVQSIDSGGKTMGNTVFNGSGGSWQLAAAYTTGTGGTITLTTGTFDTNGFTVDCGNFVGTGAATRVLTLGATLWKLRLTSASPWSCASGGLTVNSGTSIIEFTPTSASTRSFAGGSKTYYQLRYNVAGSTGTMTIVGTNSFDDIIFSDSSNARTLNFPASVTTTIRATHGLASINGTSGKLMTVKSVTAATPATIGFTNGYGGGSDFLSVQDITANTNTWYAGANSTNVSGNTNVTFTAPPAATSARKLALMGVG